MGPVEPGGSEVRAGDRKTLLTHPAVAAVALLLVELPLGARLLAVLAAVADVLLAAGGGLDDGRDVLRGFGRGLVLDHDRRPGSLGGGGGPWGWRRDASAAGATRLGGPLITGDDRGHEFRSLLVHPEPCCSGCA